MKLVKKAIAIMTLFSVIFCCPFTSAHAAEREGASFKSYQEELTRLNKELGTNYTLSPTEGETQESMQAFFMAMTIDEFDKYIYAAYEAEMKFDSIVKKPRTEIKTSEKEETRSTLTTQRLYYDGANSLYLKVYTTTVNGTTIYTGDVHSSSHTIVSYPAYKVRSYSTSFSSNKRTVACTWRCSKYISKNVVATGDYTLSCTFTAGGGNIYPVV